MALDLKYAELGIEITVTITDEDLEGPFPVCKDKDGAYFKVFRTKINKIPAYEVWVFKGKTLRHIFNKF